MFVTLLALGCYKVGRLAFSPLAGLLAVVFALGSPLIAAQFHVFMTDAPETAMVAVSVWLVIASEGFTKLRACALAGVAVGLGMLTKEPFPIFVLGVGLVTLGRGGRRAWPGVAVFAAIALAIALPWYIHEHSLIQGIGDQATAPSSAYPNAPGPGPKEIAPPRLSSANLEWYLWNLDNVELGLPLLLLAAAGFVWTVAGFVPRRADRSRRGEAVGGTRGSSVVRRQGRSRQSGQVKGKSPPTRTPRAGDRDTAAAYRSRASVGGPTRAGADGGRVPVVGDPDRDLLPRHPLQHAAAALPAVFAGGWIAHFTGRRRAVAVGALVLVVVANMMGSTFGVGTQYRITLPGASPSALQQPGYLTLYPGGFLVSGPHRDGDLLATLQALRSGGVRYLVWNQRQGTVEPDFSNAGVAVFAQIAGLRQPAAACGWVPWAGAWRCWRTGRSPPRSSPLRHARRRHGRVDQDRQSDGGGRPGLLPAARPHHYGPKQA